MGDLMRPLPFAQLMDWMKREYAQDRSIFGINERFFWRPESGRLVTDAFGDKLAAPVGPAAGPPTQLANNIVACYLTGARFMELKTVQKMDGEQIRAAVAKPCIEATDEGYNCEWSTELTVQEAFDEYVKAYFAIAVLAKELGLGDHRRGRVQPVGRLRPGGHQGHKIDAFIEGLQRRLAAPPIWKECHAWVADAPGRVHPLHRGGPGHAQPADHELGDPVDAARLPGGRDRDDRPLPAHGEGPQHLREVQPDDARLRVRARGAGQARLRLHPVRRPPLQGRPAVRGRRPDVRSG